MSALARRRRTRTSLAGLILTLLIGVAAWALPSTASATFKRDKAADVRAPGLKGAQKKALDIIGIDYTKTLFVNRIIVRFRGNFERQMRTRAMRNAGALIRLTTSARQKTTVGTVGSRRARRDAGAPGGPFAVVRNGREVVFWTAALNGYAVTNIEARSFHGRRRGRASQNESPATMLRRILKKAAADTATFRQGKGPNPRINVNCARIRELIAALESYIQDAEADDPVEEWRELIDEAKAHLAGPPCTPGTGTGGSPGGSGSPGNQLPTGSFSFSPANNPPTAPRAGQTVTFTGTASDLDGQVTAWRFDFGDGAFETGTGTPSATHTYADAGGYNATLTVFDDKGGASTTSAQRVLVSGPGSKNGGAGQLDCSASVVQMTFDVYVPSWAQSPTFTITDPICPGRTQSETGQIRSDLSPPGNVENDEHGQRPKVYRITVTFTGGFSPPATQGNASITVNWN